jgi:hypothetical protein
MDDKIDPGLFTRLMQMSAPARTDLLEYIGQGPVSAEPLARAMSIGNDDKPVCASSKAAYKRHD